MFKVNQYFDEAVTSIAFSNASGDATIGVMAAGEYRFAASRNETMHLISGAMTVKLANCISWSEFITGQQFDVEAGTEFDIKIKEDTAYFCEYF